jgi:hypothetical protein
VAGVAAVFFLQIGSRLQGQVIAEGLELLFSWSALHTGAGTQRLPVSQEED